MEKSVLTWTVSEETTIRIALTGLANFVTENRPKTFLSMVSCFINPVNGNHKDLNRMKNLVKLFEKLEKEGIPTRSNNETLKFLIDLRESEGEVLPKSLLTALDLPYSLYNSILTERILQEFQLIKSELILPENSFLNRETFMNFDSRINYKDTDQVVKSIFERSDLPIFKSNLLQVLRSLDYLSVKSITLQNADLKEASLVNLSILDSDLRGSQFVRANLTNTNFTNCNLLNCEFGVAHILRNKDPILAMEFIDDEKIATGDTNGRLQIKNIQSDSKVYECIKHSDSIVTLAVSNTGQYLATAARDLYIHLYKYPIKEDPFSLNTGSYGVNSIKFSPDDLYLGADFMDSKIQIWNISGIPIYVSSVQSGPILFCFLDTNLIAIALKANFIDFYHIERKQFLESKIEIQDMKLKKLDYFAEKKLLGFSSERAVKVMNYETLDTELYYTSEDFYSSDIAFSPCGRYFACINKSEAVQIWDLSSKSVVQILQGQIGLLTSVRFMKQSQKVAVSSTDKSIMAWELAPEEDMSMKTQPEMLSVNISADGTHLVSCNDKGQVHIWDSNGILLKELNIHQGPITAVSISSNSVYSCSKDNTFKIHTFDGHNLTHVAIDLAGCYSEQFSYDLNYLVYKDKNAIYVLALQSLKETRIEYDRVFSLAISKDSLFLAGGNLSTGLTVWHINGDVVCNLTESAFAWTIDFSWDGELIAIGTQCRYIKVWNIRTETLVWVSQHHGDGICEVAFSKEGLIASSGYEGTVKVWDEGRLKYAVNQNYGITRKSVFLDRELFSANSTNSLKCWYYSRIGFYKRG